MKKLLKIFMFGVVLFSSAFLSGNVYAANPSVGNFTVVSPITVGESTTGTFTCSNSNRAYVLVDNDWTTGHFVLVSNLTNPTHSGSYTMPLKASIGSHVIKIMCQTEDESLDSGWVSKSLTVQAEAPEPLTKLACPFDTKPDRIIVNFDDNSPILSYSSGGYSTSKSSSASILTGNYKVTLFGYDTSTDRASQSQPNEKFFVQLVNGGSVVASSNSTSDLQDNVKTARVEQVVNNNLNVSSAVNTVVATHSVSDSSNPNSIYPKCAAFDKISSPSEVCLISTEFTASDTSITKSESSILTWGTSNCTSVILSGATVANSGSKIVWPTQTTTYTLIVVGTNGLTQTRTVIINVDGNDSYCSITNFYASDTSIEEGDSTTLRWNTNGCTNVRISNIGNVPEDGSERVYPDEDTTYTLRAYGDNGSKTKSVYVNVSNSYEPPIIYNSNVVTTVATNVTQTGAQLNGLVTSTNTGTADVYFQYGTSVNLGSRTPTRMTNGNTNFSEYVTGLKANTIYYFQAFSDGANGVSRGAIEVFRTPAYYTNTNNNTNTTTNTTNTTNTVKKEVVVTQGTTVYGSTSPIMLRIENRYQSIGVGDVIDYTVYYKNISSSTLTNPMVQVFIPQGLTLINTSEGTYSEENKTLSALIGDLLPGEEGVIYLQAKVVSLEANLAQIVTTVILVYTNPNGAQENAMAYVLNNQKTMITNNSSLGASAFFGNIFGIGLIGWLLLLTFILLIVLIARSFFHRRDVMLMSDQSEKVH